LQKRPETKAGIVVCEVPAKKQWCEIRAATSSSTRRKRAEAIPLQPWILASEQSSLPTRIAATESASLCVLMKS